MLACQGWWLFLAGGGFNLQITLRLTYAMFFLTYSPCRPFVNIFYSQ